MINLVMFTTYHYMRLLYAYRLDNNQVITYTYITMQQYYRFLIYTSYVVDDSANCLVRSLWLNSHILVTSMKISYS